MIFKPAGVVLVVAMLATACGGSDDTNEGVASLDAAVAESDSATGESAGIAAVDDEQALLAFSACMRDQGVDFGDPTVDADGNVGLNPGVRPGDDIDRDTMRAAFETCGEHVEGVTLGFRDRDLTELEDQFLEYSVCMRDNGYDMPDPDFSSLGRPGDGPGEGGGIFGGLNIDDPAFQTAQEACQDVLAGFGPGGGGPVGGGRG